MTGKPGMLQSLESQRVGHDLCLNNKVINLHASYFQMLKGIHSIEQFEQGKYFDEKINY